MIKKTTKTMRKVKTRKVKTQKIELSIGELEAAYLACSNYTAPKGTNWKQRSQSKVTIKLREALLNAVLNK